MAQFPTRKTLGDRWGPRRTLRGMPSAGHAPRRDGRPEVLIWLPDPHRPEILIIANPNESDLTMRKEKQAFLSGRECHFKSGVTSAVLITADYELIKEISGLAAVFPGINRGRRGLRKGKNGSILERENRTSHFSAPPRPPNNAFHSEWTQLKYFLFIVNFFLIKRGGVGLQPRLRI